MPELVFKNGDLKIYLHISDLFEENTWIITTDSSIFIIDPGRGVKRVLDGMKKDGTMKSIEVLLTHGHADHVYDLIHLKTNKVYIHESEKYVLFNPFYSFLDQFKMDVEKFKQIDYKNIDELENSNKHWKSFHTPGHTIGSCCYLFKDKYFFSGDTVFSDSIGRVDLPTGSWDEMRNSIIFLSKLFQERPDLFILPGHGIFVTAEYILKRNPFFRS